jgi:hypothetical protein
LTEKDNNGKRDLWQTRHCPKMELKLPNRDFDPIFCRVHCVRVCSTEDLRACNPVELGTYGGST